MISIKKTMLEKPKTQDYILTDVLRCGFIIRPHNIRLVTSVSYGVISILFMRISIIFNIHVWEHEFVNRQVTKIR